MAGDINRISAQLESGLAAMTSGLLEGQQTLDAEKYAIDAGEMIQRIQVPIAGRVGRKMMQAELTVQFPYSFIGRTSQSQIESSQDDPHFNVGIEMAANHHIILDVQVVDWQVDEYDFVTGARLRIIAWRPDAPKAIRWNAVAHCTFIGYAAAAEDDSDTQNLQGVA